MKNTLKRVLALVLAGAMVFAFAACGGEKTETTGGGAGGAVFGPGVTIKMTIPSHPSWPYNENWVVWDYIEEATGAKVEVNAIPSADMITKVNLMMASQETLPDLLFMDYKGDVNVHAMDGAFVNIREHLDEMPNFQEIIDTAPQGADLYLAELGAGDGGVYFAGKAPGIGMGNGKIWMYRRDIFEKNNLALPTTEEELFAVARELKKLYPDSYPLCFRNGIGQMEIMGPMWKENYTYGIYYNFTEEKWCYGATEDTMLHVIDFFQKMLAEELVPPDFLTITSKSWEELILTNRGFMMPEYSSRIGFFNEPGREENPDYTWAYMDPPKGATPTGARLVSNDKGDPSGFAICNTGKDDRIANAIKYVDWLYSDEAAEILTWGKEGETYRVEGEKRVIIKEPDEYEAAKYGFGTMGVSLRGDNRKTLWELEKNPLMLEATEKSVETTATYKNPRYWIGFSAEEQKVYDETFTAVETYAKEMLAKFILKQEPLSKFDEFKATLEELGLSDLLAIHDSAYKRALGK